MPIQFSLQSSYLLVRDETPPATFSSSVLVTGKVLEVGAGAFNVVAGSGTIPLNVTKGDDIVFTKFSGEPFKNNGNDLRLLRAEDVLAKYVET